jgi:hypothetical protein
MAQFALGVDGSYTSFSGADAIATFNGTVIGQLQAITVNTQREKGPIYVMGSADPLSFSRGKRGIAGNLVFVMFDSDALLTSLEASAAQFGTIPQYTAAGNQGTTTATAPAGSIVSPNNYSNPLSTFVPLNSTANNLSTVVQFNAADQLAANTNGQPFVQLHGSQAGEIWTYEDQVPPFDITITFANEYGNAAYMTIEDVEILNEGMGVSIDDINLERACTFIARRCQRLRPGFNTSGAATTNVPISQSSVSPTSSSSVNSGS